MLLKCSDHQYGVLGASTTIDRMVDRRNGMGGRGMASGETEVNYGMTEERF